MNKYQQQMHQITNMKILIIPHGRTTKPIFKKREDTD